MSSTTTIRLDDELKTRLAEAASRVGATPHAFIVDALTRHIERSEWDADFQATAERRWTKLVAGGKSIDLAAAQAHLDHRAATAPSAKPARKRA